MVINDKTVERDVIYEEKVETTIKITKTYFYLENGKRVLVSSPTSTTHTTSSCKEICEKRKVEEIDQTQSQIGKPTRKRQRIESSGSSESDELFQTQLESQEPPWFEKWSNVSINPSGTSCRRTNPVIVPGSRVFCRYSSVKGGPLHKLIRLYLFDMNS